MQLDLTDDETWALRKLLADTIEYDRYPLSPRIRTLRDILTKVGPIATKVGPIGAPPLARLPTPGAQNPRRARRSGARRTREFGTPNWTCPGALHAQQGFRVPRR